MIKLKVAECVSSGSLESKSGPAFAPDASTPPGMLDGANVLYFARSGWQPYFDMLDTEGQVVAHIHGLAVCRYGEVESVYRFSCDENWNVINDMDCASVEEALSTLSGNYEITAVRWQLANRGPTT